nr:hypothetical protein [Cylindrospermopsis raciborskii]
MAPFGFRVAGVAPGLTNTPILSRVSPTALADMTRSIPFCKTYPKLYNSRRS